ncbi:unnamed protein product [Bemisia tabaci]|uniref:Splicing factor 45 n=1 Tax=Bemisia tabaci TaxID=7038 RepID=A0A9P0F778_BEMTA|nr:PREDICTED: splicing factor 45 [Bemisia tabaci]CAH0395297.1 unnamed protein product [Bemisia tabaci]
MSLYDDFETVKQKSDQVAGWSSGIKLFQSQLQLKKAAQTLPKREQARKSAALAPVFDLKGKKDDDEMPSSALFSLYQYQKDDKPPITPQRHIPPEMDWEWNGVEYDPMWPNDYEKVVMELREIREREREREDDERRKRREETRMKPLVNGDSDEEEVPVPPTPQRTGVAIAPPPSLQESTPVLDLPKPVVSSNHGGSVAAKIMAKYGFKEGQGLGKKEQGIAMALQVEKTSKRGGRIIHEKDIMPPPPLSLASVIDTPPRAGSPTFVAPQPVKPEPSITEIMKSPSKVVLLRNMVGPGEVDSELEPEVKDECNTKYGDVVRVLIYERPEVPAEEAVRIFVEFKRIESAIKAVVDLNGRFFGGRQVKAGFYNYENFNNLKLLD